MCSGSATVPNPRSYAFEKDGQWWHWDSTWTYQAGPFGTRLEAEAAFSNSLQREKEEDEEC